MRHFSSVISRAGDQYVDVREVAKKLRRTVLGCHVDRDADDIATELRDGFIDSIGGASVDRDLRAAAGQPFGDCEADALRRTRDKGDLSLQINVHAKGLPRKQPDYSDARTHFAE